MIITSLLFLITRRNVKQAHTNFELDMLSHLYLYLRSKSCVYVILSAELRHS